MKKHVVFKLPNRKQRKNLEFNPKTVFFFTVFLCGVIVGVFLCKEGSEEWHNFFSKIIKEHLLIQKNTSYLNMFFKTFIPLFFLVITGYIIGLCGVGVPFLIVIPVAFGIFAGVSISQYYICYNASGIGFWLLVNLPVYATTTATLIKCCCRSSGISGEIFSFLTTGKGDSKPFLKEYTLDYLILLIPVVLSSIAGVLLYRIFGGLFSFVT